ncbi:MAG TPA: right-handed parallel beta-helix repeat-containing protein [Armatimonadota bacterium]|jgi:hypothetical protein
MFRPLWLALALAAARAAAATYSVSPAGSDSASGAAGAPWKTLSHAAATLAPGDTALVADGTYREVLRPARGGTAAAPITYQAVHPGLAVLDGSTVTNSSNRDLVFISYADHVILDGFTIQNAYRAGVRIDASNGVAIRRCRCLNNGTWGIFSDYSDDTLLEYNECAGSKAEHGVYLSNSGDRSIVRFNAAHDNHASGIQLNADPDEQDASFGTAGDGITQGAIITGNVCFNNGAAGGAAINLASVRNSLISNNLLYNNLAGGISGWDNGNGQPNPTQYGCKDNAIVNNTVYFRPGEGRWCVSLKNGSTNNAVVNNILAGGARGAIEIDSDSSVVSDYNLLRSAAGDYAATNEDIGPFWTRAQWQAATGNDAHSLTADPLFLSPALAPFDFRVPAASPAVDAGTNRPDAPVDLDGRPRPQGARWDLGAYELPKALPGDFNGDGLLTAADAILALRIAGGLQTGGAAPIRLTDAVDSWKRANL